MCWIPTVLQPPETVQFGTDFRNCLILRISRKKKLQWRRKEGKNRLNSNEGTLVLPGATRESTWGKLLLGRTSPLPEGLAWSTSAAKPSPLVLKDPRRSDKEKWDEEGRGWNL